MGIEQVSHTFRELDVDYGLSEHDVGKMVIHHTYKPSDNYCVVEMKIPAISRMMVSESFDKIVESIAAPSLHGLYFKSVSNREFYNLISKESIDKVRRYDDDKIYTFYFSNSRKVRLYPHDYEMATLVYLNYPIRNFVRRTPCKDLDPECVRCIDVVAAPVRNYLNEDQVEFNVTFEKYFFSNIEDNHRLLMAFTVENIKKPGECFTTLEPEYYIQDLDVPYFRESIARKQEFKNKVIQKRRIEDRDMFAFVERASTIDYGNGYDTRYTYESYLGYAGMTGALTYNTFHRRNVPTELQEALDSNNFEKLWKYDFENFNIRNTIHKYQYNHWVSLCTKVDDGLWCAWDATEFIDENATIPQGFESEGAQVLGQLHQLSDVFGWGSTNDTSSTDTVFTFLTEKIASINYEDVIEPLPKRSSSIF